MLTSNVPERPVVFQFVYGILAVSSLLGPGMSMGYSAVALPLLKNSTSQPSLNEHEATWFASIAMISTPIGCVASLASMKAGRRTAITSAGIVCSIGWIIIATSYGVAQLLLGRFITGFATGLASTPACVYLAEISIPRYRALLTTCSSLFVSIGIMLIYLLGFVVKENWRLAAIISIFVPAASAALTLAMMPESPSWLLTKGRESEARRTLLRLRSLPEETPRFRDEFEALVRYNQPKCQIEMSIRQIGENNKSNVDESIHKRIKKLTKMLRIPEVWKPFLILNAFFIFQQFSGIYVLMAYAVDLVEQTGVNDDPYLITALIGLVQIAGAFCLVLSSFRLGRRIVASISGFGMTISLVGLGVYNQFFQYTEISAIPLACIFLFVATGSFGFLGLPWAMIGELYPTKYVNVLGPVTTFLAGIYNFATVQLYPSLVELGSIPMIWTYCVISLISTLFVICFLPETHKKTKEEVEKAFRKMS